MKRNGEALPAGTIARRMRSLPLRGRVTQYRRLCLAVLCFAYIMAFFTRYATAVIVGDLRADFELDTAAVGLVAAAYFYPYALMQPLAGLLADSLGPRRSISGFLLVAVVGTVIFATAVSFPLALLGRVLGGLGVATIYVSGTTFIARWYQAREFGSVAGIFTAAGNVGGLVAAGPLAALIEAAGWRVSFLWSAAIMLLAAALVATIVRDHPADLERDPPASAVEAAKLEAVSWSSLRARLSLVLRTPNLWLLGVYAFVILGVLSSMQGLWTVPYLRDVYGMEKQEASNLLSLWAVGLIVAMPVWGALAGRVLRHYRPVILASLALHAALWLLLALRTSGLPVPLLYALVLYAGFTNGCWIPAYAQLKETVPAAAVGTAIGLLNFAFFLGAAVFQQVTALLLQWLTPAAGHAGVAAYRAMFIFFLVALAGAFVAVACSRDMEVERR